MHMLAVFQKKWSNKLISTSNLDDNKLEEERKTIFAYPYHPYNIQIDIFSYEFRYFRNKDVTLTQV